MNCKYCGSSLGQEARFCVECGKAVVSQQAQEYCHVCGEPMEKESSFCLKCGVPAERGRNAPRKQQVVQMPHTVAPPAEEPAAEMFCTNCGASIQPGSLFCVMCGADFANPMDAGPVLVSSAASKKNNRVLTVVLVCLLLLVIVVSAFIGYEIITGEKDEEGEEIISSDENDETEEDRPAEEEDQPAEGNSDTKNVHITVVHEDGTADYCQLETKEDGLIKAMEQEELAEFAQVDGSMVPVSVLDEEVDSEQGEVWAVYQNGEEVENVSRCKIEDGDEIKFVFRKEPVEDESDDSDEEEMVDSEYLLPESNSRYLTIDDIDHLDREHLCFARNEIYARHGWIFSVPQIANYFATKSWYVGTTLPANFNYGVLNAYEQANIKLIVDYEAQFGGSYY